MTMNEKERTITKHELSAVLLAIDIKVSAMKDVMDAAFPPPYTPKEGEAIWVRRSEHHQWELIGFHSMDGEKYCCTWSNGEKGLRYPFAKPQTPTEKGE
jgi:hypothetical protein